MVKCKICKTSGKQGHIFVINDFEKLDEAICATCFQPERSKREDPTNFYINELLGCGALNTMET